DLPISGKKVFLHLRLQKWFCLNAMCSTIIFTEITAAPAYQRNKRNRKKVIKGVTPLLEKL
ncbi:hypothetical protein QI30_19165, partial [Kurthia sp. 3B1D]